MTSAKLGLQSKSQRLGVIPFVLFWNLSGNISAKSLKLPKNKPWIIYKTSLWNLFLHLSLETIHILSWLFLLTHVSFLMILEWMAATPLVAWEPTIDKYAMLIFFSSYSSTSDILRILSRSPGHFFSTSCERNTFSFSCYQILAWLEHHFNDEAIKLHYITWRWRKLMW